ncbi:MAG TPA: ATP-binding cassette domain-containing protein, partial [Acidimicrobiales bacterium]
MPLLEAQDVTVRFGGKAALNRTSIGVERGVITGLIGPNGAGKTTLFNVVCGLLAPQAGRVVLDGIDITPAPPHRRARLGLARTFQRLELFTSLTVRDNIRVGGDIRNRWSSGRWFGRRADSTDDAERIIELTGLGALADREVSEIP